MKTKGAKDKVFFRKDRSPNKKRHNCPKFHKKEVIFDIVVKSFYCYECDKYYTKGELR